MREVERIYLLSNVVDCWLRVMGVVRLGKLRWGRIMVE
jgi:hypothetical protein